MGRAVRAEGAPLVPSAVLRSIISFRITATGSYFGVGANMLSTSFIGLRASRRSRDDLYGVFNLQTLFNPMSGNNANGRDRRAE